MKNFILFILLLTLSPLQAEEYQSTENFLSEAFNQQIPKPKALWMKKELQANASKILDHKPGFLRTRYWKNNEQSVWILNEIGKTKPITVGVVIKNQKIEKIKVLAFRESRGWEVKHDFFTNQFKQIQLNDNLRLSSAIDGISGATLSVNALKKIAKLALFFDQHIQQ